MSQSPSVRGSAIKAVVILPGLQLPALLAVFTIALVAINTLQAEDHPADRIQTMVKSYCINCHGENLAEGDLRLDQFTTKQWDDYALFDEIVARVQDGEMPPEDAKHPLPAAERLILLSLLKARLKALGEASLAGTYKKLTADEYNNTLMDLFGAPLAKIQSLPFDSNNDLKKLGEHQVVTSYAVKKYYDVAADYLDRHVVVDPPPVKEITYTQPDNPKEWIHTARFNQTTLGPIAGTGNAPKFMLRSPVNSYAHEGEYEIAFEYRTFYLGDKEPFDPVKDYVPGKPARPLTVICGREVNVVSEHLRVGDRRLGDKKPYECRLDQPIRAVLGKDLKFMTFHLPNNFSPRIEDDPRYQAIEKLDLDKEAKSARLKAIRSELKAEYKAKPQLRLLITGVKIRGPLNKQPSPTQTQIFGNVKRDDPFNVCLPILKKSANQLFRRPVSEQQLKPYIEMAKSEYDRDSNTYSAVKAALNAMLCSPHFVFKHEGSQRELDDYMIAARLSFFLWNSTPDEELLTLAAAGKLQSPTVRRQQALRLLANREKSNRFTQDFTRQWLALDKFSQFSPNAAYVEPNRYAAIQPHIAQEPQEFFNEVLYQNLSALNFIDSDFVVWNQHLLSHYADRNLKIESDRDIAKDAFQKMALRENPNRIRGGLTCMAAIMSLTTDGENTQPILRGVWLARRMLGTKIEAPATVPAIEINLENVSRPRDVLARHKSDRSCYACHVKFDYLGLAMENYDVVGRFQTDYVHPVINEKGRSELITKDPIDSLSETPAGEPMPGVKGLKRHLMENKTIVMRNLVEQFTSYAFGRKTAFRDRDQIDRLLKGMRESDYRLQDFVLNLVASRSFVER